MWRRVLFSFTESETDMTTFSEQQQAKVKEEIKEHFFAAGNHILKPIITDLNEIYPSSKRRQNSPSFDQAIFDEHESKFLRARNHLYEQRNLVQRKWLPRYIIKTGTMVDSVATQELRSIIVEGAFDRLYEMLVAYSPMFVPKERCIPLQTVMNSIFETEKAKLTTIMGRYVATFAPGIVSIAQDYE